MSFELFTPSISVQATFTTKYEQRLQTKCLTNRSRLVSPFKQHVLQIVATDFKTTCLEVFTPSNSVIQFVNTDLQQTSIANTQIAAGRWKRKGRGVAPCVWAWAPCAWASTSRASACRFELELHDRGTGARVGSCTYGFHLTRVDYTTLSVNIPKCIEGWY